ncbi:MAG: T9SS type A sorting domain-containing protein [Prevotellaceae bacterium]|nr:T9SS type A sorting domain-containing protein [Prevotellaceae bacterium]
MNCIITTEMKYIVLKSALLYVAWFTFGIAATGQNRPPTFLKFMRGSVEITDLHIEMKEGEQDTIRLLAHDPDGDPAYIMATQLPEKWAYFMSDPGASSATLLLAPNDDAQGDYEFTFTVFDNDISLTPETASLTLHVVDRNALTPNDTKVTIVNYPNPVTDITTMEFVIPSAGQTTLKIYTLSGREVLSVIDASMSPMRYFRQVNMSSYPAGVYVYQLDVKGVGSASGRLIKL